MIRRMLSKLPRRSRTALEQENEELRRQVMLLGLYVYWLQAAKSHPQRPQPHQMRWYRRRPQWHDARTEVIRR